MINAALKIAPLYYIILATLSASTAKAADCALALAFALDVSASVNSDEYDIQKGGLAAALRDPEVGEAILTEPGAVWLLAYEWSAASQQAVIRDWAQMRGQADVHRFAAGLDAHVRRFGKSSTALGRGLSFGVRQFSTLPAICDRQVIDVSGDGVNNDGIPPEALRDSGRLAGFTINGLVIAGASPNPVPYYREKVISGSDAFMMVARNGFEDYPDLIKGKLLRELRPPLFIGAAR